MARLAVAVCVFRTTSCPLACLVLVVQGEILPLLPPCTYAHLALGPHRTNLATAGTRTLKLGAAPREES